MVIAPTESDDPLLAQAESLARQADAIIAAAGGVLNSDQRNEVIGLIAELQITIDLMTQAQKVVGQEIIRQSRQSNAVMTYHRMTGL